VLGQSIDLAAVRVPIFLLAARDDEVIAPAQLLATERLVGTPTHQMRKAVAPCRHLGLFMGKGILREFWPRIARWLVEPCGSDALPVTRRQASAVVREDRRRRSVETTRRG
jgi:poly(3-hydroxyalkanoate) synthetase